MRTIGVVTVARSDYGIYRPILRAIDADPELRLRLIVSGMHLAPEFGSTVDAIDEDGFEIAEKVEMLLSSDSPEGVSKSMGLGTIGFAQAFARERPDILMVLGDRFEMFSAALAALPFTIPVAHLHGGEVTEGAIDDSLRHCMTKLSHLHFVSTEDSARRVRQLGEEPWRIVVSGAPSLDEMKSVRLLGPDEFESKYGVSLTPEPLLVTFHPVTLEYEQAERQIDELLEALDEVAMPVIFTMPNADTGGRAIAQRIERFVADRSRAWILDNLGTQGYFSLLAESAAMVGNSSSGLIEAPSFGLPVVNVGARQAGRVRGENVIDVEHRRAAIVAAIGTAVSSKFRAKLRGMSNPYGQGNATRIIVDRLRAVDLNRELSRKRFFDVPPAAPNDPNRVAIGAGGTGI